MYALVPILILIGISFTTQDAFAETRQECRSLIGGDQTLTPVERIYALKTCESGTNTASTFHKLYSQELHEQCARNVALDHYRNHMVRLLDLEQCHKINTAEQTGEQKITKFSKDLIQFCGEKYGVYQLVGAKKMYNHAGKYTEACLFLYSAPMWNSTGPDRSVHLHNFVQDALKKSLDESHGKRLKAVEDARISRPLIINLDDLFEEQKQKIESLEKQIQEKNLDSNLLDDILNENFENCLAIYYDKGIQLNDKIAALTLCYQTENTDSIPINHNEIVKYSKYAIQFCQESYHLYTTMSTQDYYDSIKNPITRKCVMLYNDPIWEYDKPDRTQVLEAFLYGKIIKNFDETSSTRTKSVDMANLDGGKVPILEDLYRYQQQKIVALENILDTN